MKMVAPSIVSSFSIDGIEYTRQEDGTFNIADSHVATAALHGAVAFDPNHPTGGVDPGAPIPVGPTGDMQPAFNAPVLSPPAGAPVDQTLGASTDGPMDGEAGPAATDAPYTDAPYTDGPASGDTSEAAEDTLHPAGDDAAGDDDAFADMSDEAVAARAAAEQQRSEDEAGDDAAGDNAA